MEYMNIHIKIICNQKYKEKIRQKIGAFLTENSSVDLCNYLCKSYWKSASCVEIYVRFRFLHDFDLDYWKQVYYNFFNQEFVVEYCNEDIILSCYHRLDDIEDADQEKYFVLFTLSK